MGRILEILFVFGLLWFIVHLLRTRVVVQRGPVPPPGRSHDIRMVRCAHCGVHVPEPEAIRSQGHDYCSAEHRSLGPRGW